MRARGALLVAVALAVAFLGWRRFGSGAPARSQGAGQPAERVPLAPSPAAGGGPFVPVAPSLHPCAERNRLALEALSAGRLSEAIELFGECHGEDPDEPVFRDNLVEALLRRARVRYRDELDLPGAIADLERALEVAAASREDEEDLRATLARWRSELALEAHHETLVSDLFELSYDTRRDDLLHHAQEVLNHLETVYEDLRDWFQTDPVRSGGRGPIKVVLYDRDGFEELTGLGDWAGGVFDGVVRVPVGDLARERSRWESVLRHELVHAFVHAVAGGPVPGWLNEGLAQRLAGGADVAAASARLRAAYDGGRRPFGFERLEGSLATWRDTEQIGLAYAQSLVLVVHIERNYGDLVLRAMIGGYAEGTNAAESFERATGVPLAFVLEDFQRYL